MSTLFVNVSDVIDRSNLSQSLFFDEIPLEASSSVDDLMAAAAILPEQMPSVSGDWPPEKKLAAAVLTSGLSDIRLYHGRPSHHRRVRESLAWIHSDDTLWPFSFLRLCTLLSLDADSVRTAVARWIRMPQQERELNCRRAACVGARQ